MEIKLNKSSVFVRGILGYEFDFFSDDYINTYLLNYSNNDFLVVFQTPVERAELYNNVIFKQLQTDSRYVSHQELDKYIIYRFTIPEKFRSDIEKFKGGHYSSCSKEYKETILNCIFYSPSLYQTLEAIFNPSDEDRLVMGEKLGAIMPEDCEIFDKPDITEEVYTEEIFK